VRPQDRAVAVGEWAMAIFRGKVNVEITGIQPLDKLTDQREADGDFSLCVRAEPEIISATDEVPS
jgi:hypothetical protein